MLRVSKVARLAAGMAIALSLAVGGFAQPMAQGLVPAPQVPERLPELIKAIATELNALWDKVKDMPALKEALSKPMALAKDALEALKEAEGPGEEALKDLVILSLSLHRIEDVFERGIGPRVRERLQAREHGRTFPGMGPRGMAPGAPGRGPERRGPAVAGRFAEVRDWVEAYLKGVMSALSPEEATKFRGIVRGLVQGLQEEFAPRGPKAERPVPEALELGRHILRIKALSARLDLFIIRAIKATEAPAG